MLARRIALVVVLGLPAATLAGGCGSSSKGVASNSVGSGGGGGGSDAGVEASVGGGPQGCSDGVKNGSETDVDCGGSCPSCDKGMGCTQDSDCGANVCHANKCCSTSPLYTKTTGSISGVATVCCDGNDVRTDVHDCASGANHYAKPTDPNCAEAGEGANNGGDACALITCEKLDCSPAAAADAGSG